METIQVFLRLGVTDQLPTAIELKLATPVKAVDLVLMLLEMYPVLSSYLPRRRTEASLRPALRVTRLGTEIGLSDLVEDGHELTFSLR